MTTGELIGRIAQQSGVTYPQALDLALWLATDGAPCPNCRGNGREDEIFAETGEHLGHAVCRCCGGCGVDLAADWLAVAGWEHWERSH